jgi:hypothetical protein
MCESCQVCDVTRHVGDFCCNKELLLQVCHSAAGYYIGTWCKHCGPYQRYSRHYYKTESEAKRILKDGEWIPRW